jgi:hypothetical protein
MTTLLCHYMISCQDTAAASHHCLFLHHLVDNTLRIGSFEWWY